MLQSLQDYTKQLLEREPKSVLDANLIEVLDSAEGRVAKPLSILDNELNGVEKLTVLALLGQQSTVPHSDEVDTRAQRLFEQLADNLIGKDFRAPEFQHIAEHYRFRDKECFALVARGAEAVFEVNGKNSAQIMNKIHLNVRTLWAGKHIVNQVPGAPVYPRGRRALPPE